MIKYCLLFAISLQFSKASINEEKLFKDLFANFTDYSVMARPVLNDEDTVNVTFGLTLYQIIDVQEKNEMMITNTWVRMKWKNPMMTWNPKKYNGIQQINVKPDMVWTPDLVLYNSIDDDKVLSGNLNLLKTLITINFTGDSTWLAPVLFKSKCDIDVTYFPYDTQNCPLQFGSWTYDKDRLSLIPENDTGADLHHYALNSEFQLNKMPVNLSEKQYECCPAMYQDLKYYVNISRRTLFYQFNLVFPMVVIGMLTMCSFLLPAESGERMGLALTLLLSMTVFMLLIADMIPTTSDCIPLVGYFFKATMVEMIVMIVALSFIMKLYHRSSDDPPMPKWMRTYIYDCLSYLVRVRSKKETCIEDTQLKVHIPADQYDEHQTLIENNVNENNFVTKKVKIGPETGLIVKRLDVLMDKLKDMDEESEFASEWIIIAKTIDRCCLFLFLISYLAILASFLITAPPYVP